jgi:hypothetical protein
MRLIFALVLLACIGQSPNQPVLTGYAVLPADTFAPGPASGTFLPDGVRAPAPPFPSQPIEGFSSIYPDQDGWFWALVDNGYGTQRNSPDFLLRIYRVRPVFETRRVEIDPRFIALRDPDKRTPFHVVNDDSSERLLTGGDFDPESMVRMEDGTFWIGDEFGPFLLHVSADGILLDPPFEAAGLTSPDNPLTPTPDAGQMSKATVGRSRGFEGLAWYATRHTLVALLEAGLPSDGGEVSRLLEFDPVAKRFTGVQWTLPFEQQGDSFTELVGVGPFMAEPGDESYHFITIERDSAQGEDARFKRVLHFAIMDRRHDPTGRGAMLVVRRNPSSTDWSVDLLGISDPDHLGSASGTFTFPFITPEALWLLPDRSLLVVNDNNYPAAGGRSPSAKDNTEFIRVRP